MTDLCFLCLYQTDNKVCGQCNIHSHTECWKNYMNNYRKNILNSFDENMTFEDIFNKICIKCPQCKFTYNKRITRSETYELQEKKITYVLKSYLDCLYYSQNITERINYVKKIFEILKNNKWFLNKNPSFTKTAKEKLKEIQTQWNYSGYYYQVLFNESI